MNAVARIDGSFHQTQAMARTLGVNLTTAVAGGHLSPAEPARMIARCQACGFHEACTVWLSDCRDHGAHPPDFCANRQVLLRLAARMGPV